MDQVKPSVSRRSSFEGLRACAEHETSALIREDRRSCSRGCRRRWRNRSRPGARVEVAAAQALVERLQADVRSGQEELRLAREELEVEQAARARAESAAKDAQVAHEQARSAFETQLRSQATELLSVRGEVSALNERLVAGQAERANLTATLENLQSAVHGAVSSLSLVQPAASPLPAVARRADAGGGEAAEASGSPNTDGYVTALLELVEARYRQDVESALPPADVVKRLTDNLRYASHLFAERLGRDPASESWVLKEEIAKLLHTTSATPFGRDSAIAAGEAERTRDVTAVPGCK